MQANSAHIVVLVSLLTLSSCFAGYSEPMPPRVYCAAVALPAVEKTIPVYVYIQQPAGLKLSAERKNIVGIAPDRTEVHAYSLEEAAQAAGGSDKLLARLSDEKEVAYVAKVSGVSAAVLPLGGALQGCAAGIVPTDPVLATVGCAVGGAIGAAVGLAAAIGVTANLGINEEARRISMLETVSLPDNLYGNPIKGYIYLPVIDLKTIRVPVIDPRNGLPFLVRIDVVAGSLGAPGQIPTPVTAQAR
jgi:hypothetical protein